MKTFMVVADYHVSVKSTECYAVPTFYVNARNEQAARGLASAVILVGREKYVPYVTMNVTEVMS